MSKRTYSQVGRAKYQSKGPPAKKPNMTRTVRTGPGQVRMLMGPSAAWNPTSQEIKAVDIEEQVYLFRDPNTASNIILLNGIQAGTGFYNRVGSRVEMKNLQMNGFIGPAAAATAANPSMLRILIVYDRQPKGALPTISDILQDRNQVGTALTGGLSHVNLDNRDRFIILRDLRWYTPTVTAGVVSGVSSGVGEPWTWSMFLKLKGLGTHYNSTADPCTIANISTGALYACFVTETNDSDWNVEADFRLRYDDK